MAEAVSPSSLSLAANGVVDTILGLFGATNIQVTVNLPSQPETIATEAKPLINLFFYKILPSGFHAGAGLTDPLMIRLHCLITPFSKDTSENIEGEEPNKIPEGEINLRVLGEVIRFFNENPVIGPLSAGTSNGGGTQYTLESILRAPDMEEINHVWMMLNSDLPYRTSAVYEFSLVPIDPVKTPDPDSSVLEFGGELRPTLRTKHEPFTKDKPGDLGYPKTFSKDFQNQDLSIAFIEKDKRKDAIEFVGTRQDFADLPEGFIGIALAGLPGKTVRLTWRFGGGNQTAGKVKIKTENIEDPVAEFYPKIPRNVSSFEAITLQAEYIDQDGNPVKGVDASNSIILNFKKDTP